MSRVLRKVLIASVVVAVFYMVGGAESIRWARARWRASLQPPTADQMRAPVDTLVPLRASLPRENAGGKVWLSDPPRRVSIAIVLTAILMSAVIAMYVSGRPERRGVSG